MSRPARRSRFLSALDAGAEIAWDELTGGWILSIGGAEQSHVDLADPSRVFYEYLQRMSAACDLQRPSGQPVRALHLGAGALTLPRRLSAVRPGSQQTVIELARELPGFVLEHLPWPDSQPPRILIGDAREQLSALRETETEPFDLLVLDVFAGDDAPDHLRERSFYEEMAQVLAPDGALIVNVGDDPGLGFFREQAERMVQAQGSGGAPAFADVWCLSDASMLDGQRAGNLILLGSPSSMPRENLDALRAAGPHPAAVLDRMQLEDWLAGE
ncbi:fused MFS/spermidine synthase [Kocuria palustris]|uniref:spermidine synthase n=1 Tax=Kocuria palustris TaxID=71999 RepID=UPI00195650E1|nr:fused MFS/spermidine synthase [Kocuria palustris]MBM7822732.1 SAM-dependent methyltransferase [Kocuria palustris]